MTKFDIELVGKVGSMALIDKENNDICICKVNVDENGELAMAFKVQYIPYIVAIKDGQIIHQSSGVKTEEQIIDLFK